MMFFQLGFQDEYHSVVMSKRPRTSRALFQRCDMCKRGDEYHTIAKCSCGKRLCETCLREKINEWVIFQDLTNPYSVLMTVSQLGEEYLDLPEEESNELRYSNLYCRIKECSNCLERVLCPECSVFGYYQRCEICIYFCACNRCVAMGVLVPWEGVLSFDMLNPFLEKKVIERVIFEEEEDEEADGGVIDVTPLKLLWRCRYHAVYGRGSWNGTSSSSSF